MSTVNLRLLMAVAASLIARLATAQPDAPQAGAPQAPSAGFAECSRVQPVIQNIITAATARAEAARLSNSPSDMRAAVDHLEAALRDIRAQSAPCAAPGASTDPHAGHAMPGTPTPAATSPAPAAADPHAGHTMPRPTAPAATSAPASKPPAAKPDGSKAVDPHAGHATAQPGDRQRDPVNGLMVDPATAPKTTYQGQTYYFSSEQSRKEFLENPAKFSKKHEG